MEGPLRAHTTHQPGLPQIGTGLSVGCFAGGGYGLAVGVGRLRPIGQNSAIVTPSLSAPFAHNGALVGAFCGVVAGGGFASAVAVHIGYRWQPFERHLRVAHPLSALRSMLLAVSRPFAGVFTGVG